MRERVVRTEIVRLKGRAAVLEVQIVERPPPRTWRLRLALWMIRLAGRLARMRVRVQSRTDARTDAG